MSLGGAPTAIQRAQAAEVAGTRPTVTALISDSMFVRGAGTAYTWISRQPIKFFSPAHLQNAFAYLKVGAARHGALEAALGEMRTQLA